MISLGFSDLLSQLNAVRTKMYERNGFHLGQMIGVIKGYMGLIVDVHIAVMILDIILFHIVTDQFIIIIIVFFFDNQSMQKFPIGKI